MKKKIVSLMAVVMILLVTATQYGFADDKGKVVFINMNRTNLVSMRKVPTLKKELDNRGYIALMNIRGDKGTNDRRSYASMGAGGRANVTKDEDVINFGNVSKENAKIFEAATGKKAKGINYLNINRSINDNFENGEFGSTLGKMGQTLSDNNLKTAVIGNSDTVENGETVKNRDLCLLAMDEYGRIDMGNVDDINIKDTSMPYGISTDYEKLTNETKEYYSKSDALFIDLGDAYRLDAYKGSLNEDTYESMRKNVDKKIDKYLKEVFNMVGENDVVYVVSGFPSNLDYKNKRRLSPVVKFEGTGKGLLTSSTTRQNGIVANLDIGVDILDEFGIKSDSMVGRSFSNVDKEENVEYLLREYEKIVSISNIRGTIINIFVSVVSVSWIIGTVAILFRNRFRHKEKVFNVLKELIKLGIIMPLSFMIAPLMNFKTPMGILLGIFAVAVGLYVIGRVFIKDDLKHMGFFAGVTIALIVIDSMFGTFMMKNNIMSYDAIVGARYYGVGNEYEGVTIASAIFALSVLMNYKKIPKWSVIVISLIILITSAYPSMGANVGGAISECVAYLLFILLIYDVKIDFKKIILLGLSAVVVVAVFAFLDLKTGSGSHLGAFVQQIMVNGPGEIMQTFVRKIQMNVKLAQTSVWVNILLAGIAIIAVLIFRPSKHFKKVMVDYPIIFKGFISSMVGCIITLLVNDSGIVAAATASIYILIPIVIISINMIIFNKENISKM
jgi:hypothetical protein